MKETIFRVLFVFSLASQLSWATSPERMGAFSENDKIVIAESILFSPETRILAYLGTNTPRTYKHISGRQWALENPEVREADGCLMFIKNESIMKDGMIKAGDYRVSFVVSSHIIEPSFQPVKGLGGLVHGLAGPRRNYVNATVIEVQTDPKKSFADDESDFTVSCKQSGSETLATLHFDGADVNVMKSDFLSSSSGGVLSVSH